MLTLDPTAISFGMALTIALFLFVWTRDRLATRPARRRTRHHPAR